MNTNKKLVATITILSALVVAIIASIVIVLVANNQVANSNVTVRYTATDVACEISATYWVSGADKIAMVNPDDDDNTILTVNENVEVGTLLPPEIDGTRNIALSKTNDKIVFEYKFVCGSASININLSKIPSDKYENVDLYYYVSDEEQSIDNYSLLDYLDISLYNTDQYIANFSTKYFYIIVQIHDKVENVEFAGDIQWDLTRSDMQLTSTLDSTATTLTVSNFSNNTVVTEECLNNNTSDVVTLGWYTDESKTEEAEFPITATSETTLYADVVEANISPENLQYNSTTDSYEVVGKLVTTDTQTLSHTLSYTPISSTDTTLVIPDYYNGPNGIKPVTKILDGTSTSSLLNSNTTITDLYIGNNVTYIGNCLAYNASGLVNLRLGNNVEEISGYAFRKCTGVKQLFIPASVNHIGLYAFAGMTSVESVVVDPENKTFDSRNNCNAIVETSSNKLVSGFEISVIDNTIRTLETGSFSYLSGLTSVTIPDNVTSIVGAYAYCSNLSIVVLSSNLNSLGQYSFAGCSSLESIVIPASVTQIGPACFRNCTNLQTVTFESATGWYVREIYEETIVHTLTSDDYNNLATLLTSTYSFNTWKKS